MAFKKSYKKRKYSSKKKVQKKRTSKKSTFAKAVKKVIEKTAEHKTVAYKQTVSFGGYGGSGTVDFNMMFNPTTLICQQGTGQGDRIGDRIRVVKAVVKGVLYPYGYAAISNPTPSPLDVRVAYLTNRQSNQSAPTSNNCFQYGNTAYGLQGNLQDILGTWNKDVNHVYMDKRMKLGNSSVSGGGSSTTNEFYANNDYKLNCFFKHDLTKHFPKIVHYNDNSTTPQEKYVWQRIMLASADGSTQLATTSVTYTYEIQLTYVDL